MPHGCVLDADVLHAELRRSLNRSRADAAWRYPDNDDPRRSAYELDALRRRVGDLDREVNTYTSDGQAMLDRLSAVSAAIVWARRQGVFRGTVYGDAEAADQAARQLHLYRDDRPVLGGRSWRGTIDGWEVSLRQDYRKVGIPA